MNWLHATPLTIRRLCSIKKILLINLLYQMNITPRGKELNTGKVSTEEIIHWYSHPLPPQAPIALPNQNQTLKLVPLCAIRVSLADGPAGVDVP